MPSRGRIALLVIGLGLAVAPSAARSEARPDPAEQHRRLDLYEVLSFAEPTEAGINRSRAVGIFEATPDEVFRTATDYERLPEFAPRIIDSQVIDRRGREKAVVMPATDLPWPVSRAWVHADFDHQQLPGEVYLIHFSQLRGSLRRYDGSIRIEPWDQHRTKVTYEFLAEPDTILPRSLVNRLLRNVAAHYVHALRQRINDLHRLGRLHPVQPPQPDLPSAIAGSREPTVVRDVAARETR